jgi:hypothetical protein
MVITTVHNLRREGCPRYQVLAFDLAIPGKQICHTMLDLGFGRGPGFGHFCTSAYGLGGPRCMPTATIQQRLCQSRESLDGAEVYFIQRHDFSFLFVILAFNSTGNVEYDNNKKTEYHFFSKVKTTKMIECEYFQVF